MSQTRNVSLAHKVIAAGDDWGRWGLLSNCLDSGVANGDDRIKPELRQISCQNRDALGLTASIAPLNNNIATLLDSQVMESLPHSVAGISVGVWFEDADSGQSARLLCACHEWPGGERTNSFDKLSPSHCLPQRQDRASYRPKLAPGKGWPMSALGQKQTCAVHWPMSALPPIATTKADFGKPSCLLYPQKRTCAVQLQMSALGQKRTLCATLCSGVAKPLNPA